MFTKATLALALSTALLAGCTSTIHRTVDIDNGTGLSLDAKQRLLLVTEKGGLGADRRVVCAEPSPDAITSLAFALSGSVGTPKIGGALGAGLSEAVASIGLRTQTIQLLRDGYYRLCEGYMNGALSREQYNFALVNIGKVMIPLMAIDAIAGTPRPPAVIIAPGNPGSSASNTATGKTPGSAGDGSGVQPASTTAEASVGATATSIEIEEVNQARVGLSKDEAEVLKMAITLANNSSHAELCILYLADPDYVVVDIPEFKAPDNEYKSYQVRLAEACAVSIERMLAPTLSAKASSDLSKAKKKLKVVQKELSDAQKALASALKDSEKDEALKTVHAEQAKVVKGLAEDAIKHKQPPAMVVK